MQINNQVYGKLLAEKANTIDRSLDLAEAAAWAPCFRTNSSYHDCPIADYEKGANYSMYVMVHQASPVQQSSFSIAVPHGHFDVGLFDDISGGYVGIPASVVCVTDHFGNGTAFQNCHLHAKMESPVSGMVAGKFGLIKLAYNEAVDLTIAPQTLKPGQIIASNDLQLELGGINSNNNSMAWFNLTDRKTNHSEIFDFSLKWWESDVNSGQTSGDYIFRPKIKKPNKKHPHRDDFEPKYYTHIDLKSSQYFGGSDGQFESFVI